MSDVVYKGVLHKLGGNVKSWTKRWMVLKTDNVLYYYKDPTKAPQGKIPLTDHMFHAKEGREGDLNWPKIVKIDRTVVIRTSYRIYYMYAENHEEAAEWIKQLQSARDKFPNKVTPRQVSDSVAPVNGVGNLPTSNSISDSFSGIHPPTNSVSSSVGIVESLYDAASLPDSDCSVGSDEEKGSRDVYDVPTGNQEVDEDAVYELADHPQPIRTASSKSLTSSLPLPVAPVEKNSNADDVDQPIYEDTDSIVPTSPPDDMYEEVSQQQPSWAASKRLKPQHPPPPPPESDDDDDDDETVPLPPSLPPKTSSSRAPPPVPRRDSSVLSDDDIYDAPPPEITGQDDVYSKLEKIEKPQSPQPVLIQKARIESGSNDSPDITSLNYEPEESSEDFYVDMGSDSMSDNTQAELEAQRLEAQRQAELEAQRQEELEAQRQEELEAQRQEELEAQRQEELEAQRQEELEAQRQAELEAQRLQEQEDQRQREMERQRQLEMEQEDDEVEEVLTGTDKVELEAQRQAEFEAKIRREMEGKKQERIERLANKSKVVPVSSAASAAHSTKARRSGTNMFKAQRNRLVESDSANQEKEVKKGSSAWLEIEREKNMMQEEKIKLEQERRRLEEERERFEREKRQLQVEMARLKQ